MGQFDIDKYFRNRVKSYSEEMDTDVLWDALDLENEKKRRSPLFWITGVVGVLSIVGFSFFFFTEHAVVPSNSSDVESTNTVKQQKERNLEAASNTLNSSRNSQDNALENEALKLNESTVSNSTKEKAKTKFNISDNKIEVIPNYVTGNVLKSKVEIPTKRNSLKNDLETTYKKSTILPSNQEVIFKENTTLLTSYLTSIGSINGVVISEGNYSQLVEPKLSLDSSLNRVDEATTKKAKLLFDIYGGYSFIDRKLGYTSPVEPLNSELVEMRNESESMLEATSFGLNLRYNIGSGFYGKIGIEYLNINEKFVLDSVSYEEVPIEEMVLTNFVTASGDTTQVIGQGVGLKPTYRSWVHYNQHRFLSIPFSIGYKKESGSWSYFAEVGYHYNLIHDFSLLQHKLHGGISYEPRYMTIGTKNSYTLSAGIGYQYNSNFNFYVQPHFQSFTSSFASGWKDQLTQKYNLYGLKVGIKYSLI